MAINVSSETSGVAEVTAANFQLFLDVYIEDALGDETFELAASKKAEPDSDQAARFDISEVLRAPLTPFLPALASKVVEDASSIARRYWCQVAEAYGDTQVKQDYGERIPSSGGYLLAVLAGYKYQNTPANTFDADYITGSIPKLLTAMPDAWPVTKAADLWVTFYNTVDELAANKKVGYRLEYTDGTQDTSTVAITAGAALSAGKFYSVPVGYDQLDLDDEKDDSKTVAFFTVWIEDSNGPISGTQRYQLETNTYELDRQIFFLNSLGGLDPIQMHGHKETTREYETRRLRTFTENTDSEAIEAELIEDDRDHIETFVLNSGALTRDQKEHLAQLIGSSHAWELSGDQWLPINILDSAWDLGDDDGVFTLKIKARYAFQNRGQI